MPALLFEDRPIATIRYVARRINGSCGWHLWIEFVARLSFAPKLSVGLRQQWLYFLIIFVSPPLLFPDAMEGERRVSPVPAYRE
jgi:hypothetical protein